MENDSSSFNRPSQLCINRTENAPTINGPSSTNYPIITVYDAWNYTIFLFLYTSHFNYNKTITISLSVFFWFIFFSIFFTGRFYSLFELAILATYHFTSGWSKEYAEFMFVGLYCYFVNIVNFKAWTCYLSISNELLKNFDEWLQFFSSFFYWGTLNSIKLSNR